MLGAHRSVVVCQESLLPWGHGHRWHEPEVAQGRGGEGDAKEGGNRLEVVSWLVKYALHWPILGVDSSEMRYAWIILT